MFPIDPRSQIQRATSALARPAQGSGARFSLDGSKVMSSTMTGVSTAMPMDGLLALQANEDSTERKKRQVKRGHDLLDGLDRLKAALLAGIVPVAHLGQLKAQLENRRELSNDPGLDDVLAHIELRVAVELAKLGR